MHAGDSSVKESDHMMKTSCMAPCVGASYK
jgi:hypothetical protein